MRDYCGDENATDPIYDIISDPIYETIAETKLDDRGDENAGGRGPAICARDDRGAENAGGRRPAICALVVICARRLEL